MALVRLSRRLAGSGLLLAAALAVCPASAAQVWVLPHAEVRLVAAGYTRDLKRSAWEAEVELRLVNSDPRRRFHQQVQVEFVDALGKASVWKTFVSLAPGTAQHRRVRAPAKLGCSLGLEACPSIKVRVSLRKGDEQAALVEIPRTALPDDAAPPEGKPVYVGRVVGATELELLGGQRIRLLGLAAPERERKDGKNGPEDGYQAVVDFTRTSVMQGPLQLAFDGERRDQGGRWLALVSLEDGTDLNAELLRRGLARLDPQAVFSHKDDYAKLEAGARDAHLGLWKAR